MASGPVLVFVEQRDGKAVAPSLQLFTVARELAGATGAEVVGLVIGREIGAIGASLGEFGPSLVLAADDGSLGWYRASPFTTAIGAAIERVRPSVVLLAATALGRDLGPRLAVRQGAALATDCISASGQAGRVRVRRTLYSGRCIAECVVDPERLAIISVRPNAYSAPAREPGRAARVERLTVPGADRDERLRVLEVVRASGVRDVTEADVIVAGGRSLKSEENFRILYDLAGVLDGAVGASRAACDAGYQPHARQIGLTGKVVTPRLYIACGIDGAIQHLAGMRGSRIIVAINTKREAPIFEHATYGCCADLFVLVPLLTAELRRLKEMG